MKTNLFKTILLLLIFLFVVAYSTSVYIDFRKFQKEEFCKDVGVMTKLLKDGSWENIDCLLHFPELTELYTSIANKVKE